jgi:hypothetical protein
LPAITLEIDVACLVVRRIRIRDVRRQNLLAIGAQVHRIANGAELIVETIDHGATNVKGFQTQAVMHTPCQGKRLIGVCAKTSPYPAIEGLPASIPAHPAAFIAAHTLATPQ